MVDRDASRERSEDYEGRLAGLDETLSILVHELRNPLTIMQGFATTLVNAAEAMDPEAVVKAAKAVERGARRMDLLLSTLRDASVFDGGEMPLLLKDVLVSDLVDEVVESVQTIAPEHSLVCSIEDDVLVRVDIIRIQQILTNLLSNAIKFSPADSRVDLKVSRDDDTVTICVSDEGPGIPAERVDELFQKFSRLGAEVSGTGLGLYLSRAIARAHGGDLELAARQGRGCDFLLRLPIHSASSEASLPSYRKGQPR
ncbi:MAG: sensor histidine kinase [Actinomycetota bacterium]